MQTWLPPLDSDFSRLDELARLLERRRVVVLTGAGCSTESGIPDYRGPITRQKARNPIQYLQFVSKPEARQRYWARSAVGWPRFRRAAPNDGHRALARLEEAGLVQGVITQNVDRLHTAAGSRRVVELHGALAEVVCLDCKVLEARDDLQARISALNPGWRYLDGEIAPDGDVELPDDASLAFQVPDCLHCGGTLKPHVVFFGENVPRPVVDEAWSLFDEAEVLLVAGSSLTVFSGFRFVREAAKRCLPVAILNLGETRGDEHACLRVEAVVGEALPRLEQLLLG